MQVSSDAGLRAELEILGCLEAASALLIHFRPRSYTIDGHKK
jgi:hypothetical protein